MKIILTSLTGKRWIVLLCLFLTLFCYGQTLWFDFAGLDDGILIIRNSLVHKISPSTLWGIFTSFDPELYIPLTLLTYQIEYALVGLNPALFHATNVSLHLLNSILVIAVCQALSGKRGMSIACGLLFLVHPIHTETVAWVAARKDLLSGAFALASLLCYLKSIKGKNYSLKQASLIFYVLGMMAKVSIFPLPILFILADALEDGTISWQRIFSKVWFLICGLLFLFIALIGKAQVMSAAPPITTLMLACKNISITLLHLFFPQHLRILYVQEAPIDLSITFITCIAVSILLLGLIVITWFKGKRHIAFGLAFFLLMLYPSFFNVAKNGVLYFTTDRYTYLASVGMIYSLLWTLSMLFIRGKIKSGTGAIIVGITTVAFALYTVQQTKTWKNSLTVFTQALRYHPTSIVALDHRGMAFALRTMYDESLRDFMYAAEIRPNDASRHARVGEVALWKGDAELALEAYTRAVELAPKRGDIHFGLSVAYGKLGNKKKATDEYTEAVLLDPTFVQAKLDAMQINAANDR